MRLLVHLCCGPCAAYPMPRLLAAGHSVQGFFFNPNIHPFQEFRRRLDALQTLSRLQGWELVNPIGLDGGLNLYAYVENDPVNWVDPWGLLIEIRRFLDYSDEGGFVWETQIVASSTHTTKNSHK